MITEALRHCPGIGPVRLKQLHALGVRSWHDVLEHSSRIPFSFRSALVEECDRCLQALSNGDIQFLVGRLAPTDKWRVLSHLLEETTYFDIETMGLEYDAPITVIACWHRGELHHFVENENLDEFLNLLDDVKLLASFNGSSFDVPRVLDSFHIPRLPCPHLDLRWLCYHQGLRGSLKRIAADVGITRPADLNDADGALAVVLWQAWAGKGDRSARDLLLRYCGADVLMLVMLAEQLVGRADLCHEEVWSHLHCVETVKQLEPCQSPPPQTTVRPRPTAATLTKLRARRIRMAG